MLLLLSAADAQGVVWPEEPEEECHEEPEPCLHDFSVNNNIIQDQDDKLGVLKKCESLLSNIMPFAQAVLMPLQTKAPAAKPPASMPPPSTVPASRGKAPAAKPPQPVPGSSPFPRTEAAWRAGGSGSRGEGCSCEADDRCQNQWLARIQFTVSQIK